MNRLALVLAIAATGCAHFYKLDPKNVTALELADDSAAEICARGSLVDVIAGFTVSIKSASRDVAIGL